MYTKIDHKDCHFPIHYNEGSCFLLTMPAVPLSACQWEGAVVLPWHIHRTYNTTYYTRHLIGSTWSNSHEVNVKIDYEWWRMRNHAVIDVSSSLHGQVPPSPISSIQIGQQTLPGRTPLFRSIDSWELYHWHWGRSLSLGYAVNEASATWPLRSLPLEGHLNISPAPRRFFAVTTQSLVAADNVCPSEGNPWW